MIKLEHCVFMSPEQMEFIIEGMRNPMNSWDKSDSGTCLTNLPYDYKKNIDSDFVIGQNDISLMKSLAEAGSDHRKFMRMMQVHIRITAPLYWWKEFDTYKIGTVANSCSTMHKIHAKRFEREDFSIEHLENCDEQHWMICMDNVISALNVAREKYLKTKDKKYWWQMIQLLPSSYNQTRNVSLNYETLINIYHARKDHKLDEWREFCKFIEECFPYSDIIGVDKK